MKYKLVCFDVDGTIIDDIDNIWDVIHKGVKVDIKAVDKATKSYFSGETNFEEWVRHDVGLWKSQGVTKKELMKVIDHLKLVKGAKETIQELKKKGLKLAIVSGGLDIAIKKTLPDYEQYFDHVFIGRICFDENGKILKLIPDGVTVEGKARILRETAEKENIKLNEIVFVGDHYYDFKAAEIAGLSIAFNSKSEELNKTADIVIEKKDLREILKYIK